MEKRNRYTAEFKAKVVLEVLREDESLNQIAAKYELNPQMVSQWKREFVDHAADVFDHKKNGEAKLKKELAEKEDRYQKIVGQMSYEISWLKKNLASANDLEKRKAMFEPKNKRLSVMRQAELLSVNRTSLYVVPTKPDPKRHAFDVAIMNRIDEIFTRRPFYGYRRIHSDLTDEGWRINIKKTRRLMREMGLYAIYPKRNLSKMYHRQYIHPYLLRNLKIERPNQAWGCDITYVRLGRGKGFMYLFAIIDLYSRLIVDYELSITLEKDFVLRCLKRAFLIAKPEILNSDQGSHFTNEDYVQLLKENGIKISMDSKGRALDNIFMERFFRSLKYENIYLNEYVNPRALRKGINQYITFYNHERPHQSLDYQPPIRFYRHLPTNDKVA